MKERPIIFSTPMVRALLAGTKTQTRRVMKPQMKYGDVCGLFPSWYLPIDEESGILYPNGKEEILLKCPYGQLGDRLWVRETWGVVSYALDDDGFMVDWVPDRNSKPIHEKPYANGYYSGHVIYAAYGSFGWCRDEDGELESTWKPSIFMPKWASRITIEITDIRVERLQDISDEDAIKEGVEGHYIEDGWYWRNYSLTDEEASVSPMLTSARESFKSLWISINGQDSWDKNLWVWRMSLRRVQ